MPFIKVPGTDREIWVELHEPKMQEGPWFTQVGTAVELSPEQFAVEIANLVSEWTFLPPALECIPIGKHAAGEISARKFQKSRVHRGRPPSHYFSRAEDFAVIVLYFESLGHKQSTKQARLYWERHQHHQSCPTIRQIEEGLKVVRTWRVIDIERAVQIIRKKYRLTAVIPKNRKRRI